MLLFVFEGSYCVDETRNERFEKLGLFQSKFGVNVFLQAIHHFKKITVGVLRFDLGVFFLSKPFNPVHPFATYCIQYILLYKIDASARAIYQKLIQQK